MKFTKSIAAAGISAALIGAANAATTVVLYDIQDFGDTAGVVINDSGVALPGVASIDSISVGLSHSWLGDIRLSLTGPDGDIYNLIEDTGGDARDLGDGTEFLVGLATYTFVQSGAASDLFGATSNPIPGGTYDALSWGDGSPAGDWTIFLEDFQDADDGAIGSVTINYTQVPEPSGTLLGGLGLLALALRRRR